MRAPLLAVFVAALAVTPSFAQTPQVIPPAVFDIRGLFLGLGQDDKTAEDLGIALADLPKRGMGGMAGIHVYPARRRGWALGFGAEGIFARGRAIHTNADGTTSGPRIERRFIGLSGNVSVNFGHREGWSYVTAGIGPTRFQSFTGESAPEAGLAQTTFNFGGGARWFMTRHIAFGLDLRFYETKPIPTSLTQPGRERRRLMVVSAGIGIK
jgi:hypothetical protein